MSYFTSLTLTPLLVLLSPSSLTVTLSNLPLSFGLFSLDVIASTMAPPCCRSLVEEEDDLDDFTGFYDDYIDFPEIDEDDERLVEAFLYEDTAPQPTLADNIVTEKLDTSIIDLYTGVGKFLNKYRAGKIPKAFKHLPSMLNWEAVLCLMEQFCLMEPENWSPNAMYLATRIFASHSKLQATESFYRLVLLPRVREDVRKTKQLHFALHQSLKKSLDVNPAAFFNGILFPLCESRTCNLREAVIIGSILLEVPISSLHSSAALLKLAGMDYCGSTSYFIKLLLEKKHALPYRALEALIAHFVQLSENTGTMPVIWHQSLLAFVQRYKNELHNADKENLRLVLGKQKHKLVTPEISRELDA